jgi:gas vesicle protein
MHSQGRSEASDVLLSFLIGGLAGAAIAMLYAPRTGVETRERLREGMARGAQRGREIKDRVVGRSRELINDASHYVERGRERVNAAVEAGRETYQQEKTAMSSPPYSDRASG